MKSPDATGDGYLPDPLVAKRYGVSERTLPRWDANPSLGFPQAVQIVRRKYRKISELEAWERSLPRKAGRPANAE
jgi:hypothetical protein